MQDYAFTVKYNKSTDNYETMYAELFMKWAKLGIMIKYKEMHTDAKIPHYHGLITLPKVLYLKRVTPAGYKVKITLMFDMTGWIAYCRKNHVNILPKLFPTTAKLTLGAEVTAEQATDYSEDSDPIPALRRSLFRKV